MLFIKIKSIHIPLFTDVLINRIIWSNVMLQFGESHRGFFFLNKGLKKQNFQELLMKILAVNNMYVIKKGKW